MKRSTIAIAGASGFVGSALTRALSEEHRVIGLSRRERPSRDGVEWRACDLYSLLDVEQALEGCDFAIYLVHSMLPSARLTQASFDDLDLILADNFARAAAAQGVKQILYLGGLIPGDDPTLSPHLASRLEVERTLGAYGVPVTALRAGLVVGAGGSSLHILTKLVRRLPLMVLPRWTSSPTQPIALVDVVRAVQRVLEAPSEHVGAFDIGGPDVMSYREMMQRTARVLGKDRYMTPVPLLTPRLSTLWVSMVTGMPRALVGPLVRSLEHEMVAGDNHLIRWLADGALSFEQALEQALFDESTPAKPRLANRRTDKTRMRAARTVRSVQRLPRPIRATARWVAHEYVRWLPSMPLPGLRCTTEGPVVRFYALWMRTPLLALRLDDERSSADRALFYITGGLLARTDGPRPGRLEFRLTPDERSVLAAVHDFSPTLPWYVYEYTQAIGHLMVMYLFGRHLAHGATPHVAVTHESRPQPTRPTSSP